MKHLRHLFLAFLLLFVSAAAMAQTRNENTEKNTTEWAVRADVNGDGVVNEADIAEILAIMKQNSKQKYYWYAGQEIPTSLSANPTPSSEFTNNNWFEIGTTLPTIIDQRVTGGTSGKPWYAAVPTAAGLVAGADGIEDTSMTKISTITVNGVQYDVWDALGVIATRFTVQFYKK